MANVVNKTTTQYITSVHTPDYDSADWLINPDLSGVSGVDQKYWKVSGSPPAVVEMSQAEKDVVDKVYKEEDFSSSEDESTTTDTEYQQKYRKTIDTKAGDFIVRFYAEAGSNNAKVSVKFRVQVDDTTTISELEFPPDPTNGTGYHGISGEGKVTLTEGSHNFDVDYCSALTSYEAKIRRVRIDLRKI